MLTNWSQVEGWIKDNNLSHWIFTVSQRVNRSEGGGMPNDKVVDSDYYPDSIEEKLAITRRRLEECGMKVYGYGWNGKRITDGVCCEVALIGAGGTFGVSGIGMMMQQQAPTIDREELRTSLRKEIMAEIREADYDKRIKDLERREKEFESEKNGMIGAAIHYVKPLLTAYMQKKGLGGTPLANCAGIDNEEDVEAARIVPKQVVQEEAPEEEDPFTEEEGLKLSELMARFKKVEPQYIELIEAVVVMAEANDPTYTMAKGILLKS